MGKSRTQGPRGNRRKRLDPKVTVWLIPDGTCWYFKRLARLELLARARSDGRCTLLAGVAPPEVLQCTHAKALQFVGLEQLQAHALTQAPP